MALGQTNISTTTVESALGASTHVVSSLCTHANINKWSKYKPVNGAWPQGSDGLYGLNLSAGSNPNKWDITRPSSNYRLGDFRGYEHSLANAFPAIQCRSGDQSFNSTLWPSSTPYTQQFWCRAWSSGTSLILPTDLGISNYYVGIYMTFGGSSWWKTFGQVNALSSTKTWNFSVSAEITNPSSPAYSNHPYGTGTCNWVVFISSAAASSWQNSAPAGLIYFPSGTDGTNTWIYSGSYTVHNWVKLSSYSLTFGSGSSYQEVTVYASKSTPSYTISKSVSWISSIAMYSGGSLVSNPALYDTGMQLRVTVQAFPTACIISPVVGGGQNWTLNGSYTAGSMAGGGSRNSNVTVSSDGEDAFLSVTQGATGSDQLTWQFRSVNLGASDTDIDVVITRGATTVFSDMTGSFHGRDGYTKQYTVTINETGLAQETYTVTMTRH